MNLASVGIGGLRGYLSSPSSRTLRLSHNIDIKKHQSFPWDLGFRLWPQQVKGSNHHTWSLQSLYHHTFLFVRSLIRQINWPNFFKSASIHLELWALEIADDHRHGTHTYHTWSLTLVFAMIRSRSWGLLIARINCTHLLRECQHESDHLW